MAANSAIEWTDATWNPVVGCSIVSPGCTNCYAMRMAARLQRMGMPHYASLTQPSKAGPVWTGEVALAPAHILQAPLGWKKPKRIFVNSMGDLFHESIPDEWIDRVFAVMALCPQHTFQCLTKRAERMRNYCCDDGVSARIWRLACEMGQPGRALSATIVKFGAPWPLPNCWLGVSAERQQEADERIPLLLQTPAAVRFVSAEPLLGKVDMHRWMLGWGGGDVAHCENCGHGHGFTRCPNTGGIAPTAIRNNIKCTGFRRKTGWGGLDWIIVGGESGPHARPMHPDWVRLLRDQCQVARVPFFFKQWGEWIDADHWMAIQEKHPVHLVVDGAEWLPRTPLNYTDSALLAALTGRRKYEHHSDGSTIIRAGKQAAGRLFDDVEHSGFPR